MNAFAGRAARLLWATAIGAAVAVVPALSATPGTDYAAPACPRGMMPTPGGYYGCVPQRVGGNTVGGNFVGAPSQEMVSFCGGNYYTCIWPYGPW